MQQQYAKLYLTGNKEATMTTNQSIYVDGGRFTFQVEKDQKGKGYVVFRTYESGQQGFHQYGLTVEEARSIGEALVAAAKTAARIK